MSCSGSNKCLAVVQAAGYHLKSVPKYCGNQNNMEKIVIENGS